MGYTDLLLSESVENNGDLQRKYLEQVKDSTYRVVGLLDELINATASEKLVMNLHPTKLDLNMVISDAFEAAKPNLGERNITLEVDSASDIPYISADREALLQILTSLIQDISTVTAVDGEVRLQTRVGASDHERGYTMMQVTDSGNGSTPQATKLGFSMPSSADDWSTSSVGSDRVDLAIVKNLVEAIGGRIWVHHPFSSEGTYSLLLPLIE